MDPLERSPGEFQCHFNNQFQLQYLPDLLQEGSSQCTDNRPPKSRNSARRGPPTSTGPSTEEGNIDYSLSGSTFTVIDMLD